ncbi:unnamed protein product [Tilletia controversa]|nr:unnamed protein product [Tilletia controversa]
MATQGSSSSSNSGTCVGAGGSSGGGAGGRSFQPKHFNEGIRSEAWLDAEIPLPSLYSPRPEESLRPASASSSRPGARTPVPVSTTSSTAAGGAGPVPIPPSSKTPPVGVGIAPDTVQGEGGRGGGGEGDPDGDPDAEVDTVDPALRIQVEQNASQFLAKVADVQQSRSALQTLLDSTTELQGRAHRLRTKLVTPFETLRTLQTDLIRLHLGTELVRRAARFETLRWQLEDDMYLSQGVRPAPRARSSVEHDDDGREEGEDKPVSEEERTRALARAAFTSDEMTALLTSPPPTSIPPKLQDTFQQLLTSLTPIAAALPSLTASQEYLRAQMEAPGGTSWTSAEAAAPYDLEGRPSSIAGRERERANSRGSVAPSSALSFGKRIEEFRQRMGRTDSEYVPAPSMYY